MNLVRFHKPNYMYSLNELYNDFFNDVLPTVNKSTAAYSPAVNVLENEQSFHLEFSAPGYEKENFIIKNTNGVLTVKAELKEEKENKEYSRKSFAVVSFERSFDLPENVNADKISAKYTNGILSVELPKKEVVVENSERLIAIE
ncbi:MAG: Hsp20/alpha crystallin family protein [Prolixibacteraceae bacterium]|jgi:HSP20 family protein|nr:Hsp20/alpha crystallin family protein [Prolixibacteraceae bacterium]